MSIVIERTAVSTDPATGSVGGAVAAADRCLAAAGLRPDDIDVLVNVGVYRDGNVVEPANSALIQQGMGMHPDYVAGSGHAAFSFDLRNGACGLLNAVQAAGALLKNATAEKVLVVATEAHPGGAEHAPAGFRYAAASAAVLLGRGTDPEAGFGEVYLAPALGRTPGTDPGVRGYLDLKSMGTAGRRTVSVDVADGYAELLVRAGTDAVTTYLARRPELDPARLTLVTGNAAPGLAETVGTRFGFARSVQAPGLDAGSAGLALALHEVLPELAPGDELLLLVAGSGPMAGCAYYRVEERR